MAILRPGGYDSHPVLMLLSYSAKSTWEDVHRVSEKKLFLLGLHQINTNFYRTTLCKSAVFAVPVSVRLSVSVHPSRLCIVAKQLKISSFFLTPVALSF